MLRSPSRSDYLYHPNSFAKIINYQYLCTRMVYTKFRQPLCPRPALPPTWTTKYKKHHLHRFGDDQETSRKMESIRTAYQLSHSVEPHPFGRTPAPRPETCMGRQNRHNFFLFAHHIRLVQPKIVKNSSIQLAGALRPAGGASLFPPGKASPRLAVPPSVERGSGRSFPARRAVRRLTPFTPTTPTTPTTTPTTTTTTAPLLRGRGYLPACVVFLASCVSRCVCSPWRYLFLGFRAVGDCPVSLDCGLTRQK